MPKKKRWASLLAGVLLIIPIASLVSALTNRDGNSGQPTPTTIESADRSTTSTTQRAGSAGQDPGDTAATRPRSEPLPEADGQALLAAAADVTRSWTQLDAKIISTAGAIGTTTRFVVDINGETGTVRVNRGDDSGNIRAQVNGGDWYLRSAADAFKDAMPDGATWIKAAPGDVDTIDDLDRRLDAPLDALALLGGATSVRPGIASGPGEPSRFQVTIDLSQALAGSPDEAKPAIEQVSALFGVGVVDATIDVDPGGGIVRISIDEGDGENAITYRATYSPAVDYIAAEPPATDDTVATADAADAMAVLRS